MKLIRTDWTETRNRASRVFPLSTSERRPGERRWSDGRIGDRKIGGNKNGTVRFALVADEVCSFRRGL